MAMAQVTKSFDGKTGTDGALFCYDPTTSDKGSHAYPYLAIKCGPTTSMTGQPLEPDRNSHGTSCPTVSGR